MKLIGRAVLVFVIPLALLGCKKDSDSDVEGLPPYKAGDPGVAAEAQADNPKVSKAAPGEMPPGHPQMPPGHAQVPPGHAQPGADQKTGSPTAPKMDVGKIEPAPGGAKIADVYAKKDKLAGKQVTVRGKVVKFNTAIMNRNWLHIQDGSGAAGTGDLAVTTNDTANVGDVVTVKGTLALDKDFGAGYKYAVIVENATLAPK